MTLGRWPGSRRRAALLAAAIVAVTGVVLAWGDDESPVLVRPGESVADAAASGRPVILAAGVHPGFVLEEHASVRAEPGAVVDGGVVVRGDRTRLEGLHVTGGESGISVDGARGVTISDTTVEGATWHGIEVVAGTADVTSCQIHGLVHHLAQGIEFRNSNGMGRSRVEGCTIEGGQEGIVSHVSRVEIIDNVVQGTTMRGIAVTEMSEGLVEGNRVSDAMGTGLFCGDMSHCEIRRNEVRAIAADPAGIRSRSGQSLVAWYYSTIRVADNDFASRTAEGDAVGVYHGSIRTQRFPLSHWPPGWRGALPGLWATAAAIAALVALRFVLAPLFRALRRRWAARRVIADVASLGMWAFAVTGVVQSAHFVEHVVQVHQVHVADAEVRSGLVGARFDTEWLHLGYNSVVLLGALVGVGLAAPALARQHPRVLPWFLAGVAAQGWHVVEHVARVLQYLDTGISPAPGVFGGELGLVWFHYAINLPITVALAILGAAWIHRRWPDVRGWAPAGRLGPVAVPRG